MYVLVVRAPPFSPSSENKVYLHAFGIIIHLFI